jgi:hypothetical protein
MARKQNRRNDTQPTGRRENHHGKRLEWASIKAWPWKTIWAAAGTLVALYGAAMATYAYVNPATPAPQKGALEITAQPVERNVLLRDYLMRHEPDASRRPEVYDAVGPAVRGAVYVAQAEAHQVNGQDCFLRWQVHDGGTSAPINSVGTSGEKRFTVTQKSCVFSTFFWVRIPPADSMFLVAELVDKNGTQLAGAVQTARLLLAHSPG